MAAGPAVKELTARVRNGLQEWELLKVLPQFERGDCKEMDLALAWLVVK